MIARINKKAKLAFAGSKTPSMGVFYSAPTKGSKRGHQLTIKSLGQRVDLTFNQISLLERVIKKARRLATKSN